MTESDKITKFKNELIELQEKLKNNHPFKTKKQVKSFYDDNVELIEKYELEKKLIKKRITTINYNIRYNSSDLYRQTQNKYESKSIKKVTLLIQYKELNEKYKELEKLILNQSDDKLNNECKQLQKLLNDKDNENNNLINENKQLQKLIDDKHDENKQLQKIIDDKNELNELNKLNDLIKIEKEKNFVLNRLNLDQKDKINNLKNEIKNINLKNISQKSSSDSNDESNDEDDKDKININYNEVKILSDMKINKYLFNLGYKYNDLKDLSFHEKKQLFNKNNNEKFKRLFSNV